jgi:Protein of unknown function (DUF4232)
MARRAFSPWTAVLAITVAAAVVTLTLVADPASAEPSAPGAAAAAHSDTAACRASDLRISVPAAITGDPADGMGKQAWNVVFRNIAGTACSVRGWPRVAVRATTGKTVATRVSDVRFSNLAVVPEAQIVLRPAQSAVVTAMSPATPPGCVDRWALGLTLPGAGHPVTVHQPAGSHVPCVGGQLQLSPFYAMPALTREIKSMTVSTAPSPFAVTSAAEPAECRTAELRARVATTVSDGDGSVVALQLSNDGGTCVLPANWPTVRVAEAGGAGQVAKLLVSSAALQAGKALLTTYQRGTTQKTALTLRPGQSVSIALLAAGNGTRACRRVTSVTVYPSTVALGAGRAVRLTAPVSLCGPARTLSYLPSRPSRTAAAIARRALPAAKADLLGLASGSASSGFYYGTDSAAPYACGNGPYTEPVGDCANGTHGYYGEYIGEMGSYLNWKGCTTSGLNWIQANYNMANDNLVKYHVGLGAAAYWFAAGPGRDPHYDGTVTEATAWGVAQARQVIASLHGSFFGFRYIFMDIENNGTAPDGNGWNTAWNSPCGNTVRAWYIDPAVDYATFSGFRNYIDIHSPYLAGVYSAGGRSYGSWAGIFGGGQIHHTAEWTFDNEQAKLGFPWSFSDSGANAWWFASAPAACHLMWQWSGGNGVLNSYGDFDQASGANNANPACLGPGSPGDEGFPWRAEVVRRHVQVHPGEVTVVDPALPTGGEVAADGEQMLPRRIGPQRAAPLAHA